MLMEQFLKDELLVLLEKARAGHATGVDYSRIAAIINADQTGELIAEADNFLAQEDHVPSRHIEPYNYDYWQRAFLEIKQTWQQQKAQPAKVKRIPKIRYWWVAASILLIIAVGTYVLIKKTPPQQVAASYKILPGKEGAILTLADGSQVLLDSIQNGVVAMQAGTTAKIVNGTLVYEGVGKEVEYNVMSTPKARKFHVILPDGTNAWLNSASSIRYPTTFTGNERKVTITGEVYFEVATLRLRSGLKMPFNVNVNNQAQIEVLGTHFNVKAYDNERVLKVTLLEGKVKVIKADGNRPSYAKASAGKVEGREESVILKPGEQATISQSSQQSQFRLSHPIPVQTDGVMAWKNGVFDFNDISFQDAMAQLERWYDIEVVYEKGIPTNVELNGKMTKDITLNELVGILEKIGVKCRLEGRKLLIQS